MSSPAIDEAAKIITEWRDKVRGDAFVKTEDGVYVMKGARLIRLPPSIEAAWKSWH